MPEVLIKSELEVPIDPVAAFRIFTEEIDDWWVRSPTTFQDGARALALRIEPGVGGRLLEIYDDETGDALELGRVTAWEPGRRLVLQTPDRTECEFRFEATRSGTRVSVEQRALPGRPTGGPVSGTAEALLDFFADRARQPAWTPMSHRDLPRISPVLGYADVDAAARWLIDAFGLEGKLPQPGRFPSDFPRLFHLYGAPVILVGSPDKKKDAASVDHMVYAYVDDLDAHFARAHARGAAIVHEIRTRGDRTYVAEDLEGHRWTFAQARPTQKSR